MKTIQMTLRALILSLVFFTATSTYANNTTILLAKNVRQELVQHFQNPELKKHGISEAEVWINFTVNADQEIIILDITTDSPYLKEFVKARLEKQKLEANDVSAFEHYNIKVKFQTEKP